MYKEITFPTYSDLKNLKNRARETKKINVLRHYNAIFFLKTTTMKDMTIWQKKKTQQKILLFLLDYLLFQRRTWFGTLIS